MSIYGFYLLKDNCFLNERRVVWLRKWYGS